MHTVATTWDGIELWLVGLPFAAQVAVVMVVALPLAALAARVLDRVVGAVSALVGTRLPCRRGDASTRETSDLAD